MRRRVLPPGVACARRRGGAEVDGAFPIARARNGGGACAFARLVHASFTRRSQFLAIRDQRVLSVSSLRARAVHCSARGFGQDFVRAGLCSAQPRARARRDPSHPAQTPASRPRLASRSLPNMLPRPAIRPRKPAMLTRGKRSAARNPLSCGRGRDVAAPRARMSGRRCSSMRRIPERQRLAIGVIGAHAEIDRRARPDARRASTARSGGRRAAIADRSGGHARFDRRRLRARRRSATSCSSPTPASRRTVVQPKRLPLVGEAALRHRELLLRSPAARSSCGPPPAAHASRGRRRAPPQRWRRSADAARTADATRPNRSILPEARRSRRDRSRS